MRKVGSRMTGGRRRQLKAGGGRDSAYIAQYQLEMASSRKGRLKRAASAKSGQSWESVDAEE